jgi:hypothetical protein
VKSLQTLLARGLLTLAFAGIVYWGYTTVMTQQVTQATTAIQESTTRSMARVQEKQARLAREAEERAAAARAKTAAAARAESEQLMHQQEQERLKAEAWARYYVPPAACEKPPTWDFQVECGNRHIRAKREFEAEWNARAGTAQGP